MSELGDFFKQQNKKKTKKTTKPAASTADTEATVEETKKEEQAKTEHAKKPQDFAESSDEEQTDIKLGDEGIKDLKEVETRKKREEEQNNEGRGWIGLEKQGDLNARQFDAQKEAREIKRPDGGQGNIEFKRGGGMPMFSNKKKGGVMKQEDFPELGAEGVISEKSKKDSAMIGSFGSMAVGPRTDGEEREREPRPIREQRGPAQKPVFKGKAKLNSNVEKTEDDVPTKQNYDFSVFNRSAASSKRPDADRKEGGYQRDSRRFDDNEEVADDWEEVAKKERKIKPKFEGFGQSQFGQSEGTGNDTFQRRTD